jgi:TPR repeat protein
MNMDGTCPLCRAKTPTLPEEQVKYLRPWVKKKKAWALVMMAQKYKKGKGVKQSYEIARMLYEQATQQGDVGAMTSLGFMYEHGRGVEVSYERAFEYYKHDAHLGYAYGQSNLGKMYYHGKGATQSYARAKEYWELAVEQGHAVAMFSLACLYANGEGVERDLTKARELFTNAAALRDNEAINALKQLDDTERQDAALDPSAIVCSDCGIPQTSTRSFNKFRCPCKSTRYCNRKCQKKHWKEHRNECKRLIAEIKRQKKTKTEAMATTHAPEEVGERKEEEDKTTTPKKEKKEEDDECPICLDEVSLLSSSYKRFACCGKVLHTHCATDLLSSKMKWNCPLCRAKSPTSHEEHVKYLRPWVKKKKAWAQCSMGEKYYRGQGVKQSYEMARRLNEQAAQQGDAKAMVCLGRLYETGRGVEQSYEKAFAYYEQAAQLGFAQAQFNLGLMYEHGVGVEQSYEKAFEYYEQAADLGFAQAQLNLGCLYANGYGVVRDMAKAQEWWTKAAAQGQKNAIKNLKLLNS